MKDTQVHTCTQNTHTLTVFMTFATERLQEICEEKGVRRRAVRKGYSAPVALGSLSNYT